MENSVIQIVLALVAVLGGAGAWQFYSKKLELKYQSQSEDKSDQNLFRDQILQELDRVKQELADANQKVIELTGELGTLRERVKNLESENDRLLRNK